MLLPSLATLSVHCIAYNTWDFKILRQYEQSLPIEQLQELLMLWSFRVLRLSHTFMKQLEHCEAWRVPTTRCHQHMIIRSKHGGIGRSWTLKLPNINIWFNPVPVPPLHV